MFGIKTYIRSKISGLSLRVQFFLASLGQVLKKLPSNDRKVLFTLENLEPDQDVPRYQYLIINYFAEAAYNVYIYKKTDPDFFVALGPYGRYLYAAKNVKFITALPEETGETVYVFDHETPDESMLKRPWKKLVYFNSLKPLSWQIGRESINIPYTMSPDIYHYGQHRQLERFRNNPRKVRAFFAGNTDKVYYNNPILKKYGQMTRLEGMDALLSSGRKITYQPGKKAFYQLMRSSGCSPECVICDFSNFKIPPGLWLDFLSRSDFFICFSGTDFPMCHNAIESMAVGTIPILSYGDWFDPPLEHDRNAILYSGKEDLIKKIDMVMGLSREEITRIQENVIRYYEEHLSPQSFVRRFEALEGTFTMVLLPQLFHSEEDLSAKRKIEQLNARLGIHNGNKLRSDKIILRAENVSKKFCRDIKRSMLYGVADIGKNVLCQRTDSTRLRKDEFWAVEDVSFEIERGKSLGLIGSNGSGKTTILKMLSGIFWPDKGKITVKGRVGALIAVGAGFHPLLTGRENIYANGAILGMGKKEVEEKFDAIVDFSGIGDFLDTPVKHYSSGMFVRLGFAVAIHCDPDILLVDEVLTVGDMNFQRKCKMKLKELEKQGVTKIFVSHDLSSVEQLCDRAIHLSHGKVRHYGDTLEIINAYKKEALLDPNNQGDHQVRYGTRQIVIHRVEFLDRNGIKKNTFKYGEYFKIRAAFHAREHVVNPEFTVGFWTLDNTCFIHATTRDHGIDTRTVFGDGEFVYTLESLPIHAGRYLVSIGSWDASGHVAHDQHEKLYEILVEEDTRTSGDEKETALLDLPGRWQLNGNFA